MSEKCLINPERDCYGLIKAMEVEKDLNELRASNSKSHERFFERLEEIERNDSVREVQYSNLLEKLGDLSGDLSELKTDSKAIVSQLSPLTHKMEEMEELSKDVEEMKSRPAKRWENIVEAIIGLVVAAVVGYMLAAVGLG